MAKNLDKVIIFTDGACSGNPGPGGWGAILVSPLGKVRELGGADPATTNNRMELTASLEALRALAGVKKLSTREIKLYTDSKYLIQGITSWVHGWKKNGWKTADGKDVANRDLWEAIQEVVRAHAFLVDWLYVPAHQGNPGNERCDEIAVAFSKSGSPTLYQGDRVTYPVEVRILPKAEMLSGPAVKKGPPIYLSFVNGVIYRDMDWKTCENRVRGADDAKFKKTQSPEEEEELLVKWGAKNAPR